MSLRLSFKHLLNIPRDGDFLVANLALNIQHGHFILRTTSPALAHCPKMSTVSDAP